MNDPVRWPICLRLRVGGARLLLPAALFEQTLACNPLEVARAARPGWHLLGTTAGDAFAHVGFAVEDDAPWEASWLAVFRRLPESVAGPGRLALVMSEAPRVMPPLAPSLAMGAAPGSDTAARVELDGEELLIPDLHAIAAAAGAGRAPTGVTA